MSPFFSKRPHARLQISQPGAYGTSPLPAHARPLGLARGTRTPQIVRAGVQILLLASGQAKPAQTLCQNSIELTVNFYIKETIVGCVVSPRRLCGGAPAFFPSCIFYRNRVWGRLHTINP